MPEGLISSTADMLGDIGADFFDGADPDPGETPAEVADAAPADVEAVDAATEEAPAEEPGQTEETTEETTEEPVEAAPADQQKTEATQTQTALPAGVRTMKDRAGNQGYFVDQKAWDGIASSTKLVDDISNMIHAPATLEQIELRNRAYEGQERMYTDFLSGDPTAQRRFIDDWITTSKSALASGEIGGDPWVPFVGQLLEALEQGSPDAYDTLRMADATRLVDELYEEAAKSQNQNLFKSAGHVAIALGLKHKPTAQMQQFFEEKAKGIDEVTRLRQENDQLRNQTQTRQAQNEQQVYSEWTKNINQANNQAIISNAIQPALSNSLEAWKKLPGGEAAFNDLVVSRMNDDISKTIKADTAFMENIQRLHKQAGLARGEARDRIGQQIQQMLVNKAQLVVKAKRGEIETFAANLFKQKSDQEHARRQTAQTQRAPKGASSPRQTSLVPNNGKPAEGGFFNAKNAAKEAADLIAAM